MTDLSSIPAITPATLGFRMPAEWESHAATWLAWPHNLDTWPGKFAPIPGVYVAMVKALHMHEPVNICVNDAEAAVHVRHLLTQAGVDLSNVTLYEIPTNDTWARDYGPIFLTHTSARQTEVGEENRAVITCPRDYGPIFLTHTSARQTEVAVTDWIFNCWGEKY